MVQIWYRRPGGEFDEFGDINGAMGFAYCALRIANL
jgi:hypothetical protein